MIQIIMPINKNSFQFSKGVYTKLKQNSLHCMLEHPVFHKLHFFQPKNLNSALSVYIFVQWHSKH